VNASKKATLRYGHPKMDPNERDVIMVGLAGAVSSKQKKFKTLHAECGGAVNEKRFCAECDADVAAENTLKGFEYTKGHFITFTPEEIEGAKTEREPFIDVTKFVPRTELTTTMLDKVYFLIPGEIGSGKYGALFSALTATKSVGLGRQALWGKEHPVAVYPSREFESGGVLMMATLAPFEDLVAPDFGAPTPSKQAALEARERVESLLGHLEPEDLQPEDRVRIFELINAKVVGEVSPPDLVASLKETVKKQKAVVKK
jgi:DNA end-binding protein Ku